MAQAQGVSVRTVYKWMRRFPATDAATVEQIIERRQQRQTYRQIAQALGIGQSTVV